MTGDRSMVVLAGDYLTKRCLLGFDLSISGAQITAFVRFVDAAGHTGPFSWVRRLEVLRPPGDWRPGRVGAQRGGWDGCVDRLARAAGNTD
jgi:hypothetical protein